MQLGIISQSRFPRTATLARKTLLRVTQIILLAPSNWHEIESCGYELNVPRERILPALPDSKNRNLATLLKPHQTAVLCPENRI